ncbi:MAG: peptide chain release factor N(5)-glutamine methyltransferase [Acidimicrobiia bacterium]|nr:peptide chain release factor N(5)-glutamine methyltransferase [Acidimicrobiia bacterium]
MPADDGTIAWRELYDEARDQLAAVGDTPDVDARRIVEAASGHEGADFALGMSELVTERGMARFDAMLARRLRGEPLQYVVGRWGFRTLDLAIDQRVLIPRPETETVVEVALSELDRAGGHRVLDLGTGSGAIALSIAVEREETEVWAVERSADAVVVARANLAGVGRAATRVRIVEGSWFEALDPALEGTFDLIVSNPPYVAADDPLPAVVADWEPAEALIPGPAGTEAIAAIVTAAPRWLRAGASLVVELAPPQSSWAVDAAAGAGLAAEVLPDLHGRDRVLVARA